MQKRRSKKDRMQAEQRRLTKPFDSAFETIRDVKASTLKKDYLEEIFSYDPSLIVKDLKKTFLVVLFVLLILLTIALLYT